MKKYFLLIFLILGNIHIIGFPTFWQGSIDASALRWGTPIYCLSTISTEIHSDSMAPFKNVHAIRNQIQLMVVPSAYSFTERKERIKKDPNLRAVISHLRKQLSERGYFVKDFKEAIQISEELEASSVEISTDPNELLIQSARADIFVEVEFIEENFDGGRKKIHVQLKAVDKYTSESYAESPMRSSNKRYGAGIYRHIQDVMAAGDLLNKFIEQLDESVIAMSESAEIIVESRNTQLPLDREIIKNQTLIELLDSWVHSKPDVKFVAISGFTNRLFRFQAVRSVAEAKYSPFNFGLELRNFLTALFQKAEVENNGIELKVVGKRIYIYLK